MSRWNGDDIPSQAGRTWAVTGAKRLWEISEELTGVNYPESSPVSV